MDKWFRTNGHLEAMNSLEMVCDQLPKVVDDVHVWKWVIIALHNALQGYMVLALKGSDSLNVYTEKTKKKWLDAYRLENGDLPDPYMDNFSSLYAKIQDPKLMERWVTSQTFKPEGTQTASIEMLIEIRNNFIHFLPKISSLETSGLPHVTKDCIDVIDFLTFKSGNIFGCEENLEVRTRELINKIRLQLNTVREEYGD
jgi:hypothetical protein